MATASTKKQFTSKLDKWTEEIQVAEKSLEKFHRQGKKVVERFLDAGKRTDGAIKAGGISLNLFTANITTLRAMMFGQIPTINVDRRYNDPNDDQARVASSIMERLLNLDVQKGGYGYNSALRYALDDRLLPGMGQARVRYEIETETIEVAAQVGADGMVMAEAYEEEKIVSEKAPVDYVYWQDFIWSPARCWSEVRWVGFKVYMTMDQAETRFGEDKANQLQYTSGKEKAKAHGGVGPQDALQRACVYEIWDKDSLEVVWYAKGATELLDEKPDPLKLELFFPCPEPLISNATTSSFMPLADYILAQDLYDEVDALESRIGILTKAVKVVGVYDKSSEGVKRMLQEGVDNELIPVDNWAMFAEKGGLQGQVDWLPLEAVSNAIKNLQGLRDDAIALLYQVTGMSDIMRGAGEANASATAESLKAKFASTRVQAMQDKFAEFASELQSIKAEIIAKHFDPESILKQSSIMYTTDAELAPQAVELIKDYENARLRIQVRPESVAMVDYAQVKAERMEYLQSLGFFFQSTQKIAEQQPDAAPYMLELLKWGLAGFKGSQEIEGVVDKAISALSMKAKEPPPPPPPDPKVEAAKMRMQADMARSQQSMSQSDRKFQQDMQQDQAKFTQEMIAEAQSAKNSQEIEKAQFTYGALEKMMEGGMDAGKGRPKQ